MNDISGVDFIFSIVITWSIGLAPPILIRYALLKRPVRMYSAIYVCVLQWVFNYSLFTILGSQSKTHFALALIAFASYGILRSPRSGAAQRLYIDAINAPGEGGITPLMSVSGLGDTKGIKELIEDGATIDATDERGWTPLMYAANNNKTHAIQILLKHGADAAKQNAENQTAYDIARLHERSHEAAAILYNETLNSTNS